MSIAMAHRYIRHLRAERDTTDEGQELECPNCHTRGMWYPVAERDTTPSQPAGMCECGWDWVKHCAGEICPQRNGKFQKATPPQEVAAAFCFECDDRGRCASAELCYAHHKGYPKKAAAPEVAVPAEDYRADFDPDAIVATLRQKLAAAERESVTLREWKESAMKQLAKADVLKKKLPVPKYWGWDVYDATVDYLETLRERNEELQKALQLVLEELNTGWTSHTGQRIRAMVDYTLTPSAERKPEVKG